MIGPTSEYYVSKIKEVLDMKGEVCSNWTYKLDGFLQREFHKINDKGDTFYIYFYISGKGGGTGKERTKGDYKVHYRGRVIDFIYKDEPKRTPCPDKTADIDKNNSDDNLNWGRWYVFDDIEKINPSKEPKKSGREPGYYRRLDKPEPLTRLSFSAMRHPRSRFIIIEEK